MGGHFCFGAEEKGKVRFDCGFSSYTVSEKERGGEPGPLASVFVGGGGKADMAVEKNGPFCLFFCE